MAATQVVRNSTPLPRHYQELLQLMIQQGIASSRASIFAAVATFAVFALHGLTWQLFAWLGLMLATSGARLYLLSRGQRGTCPFTQEQQCRLHYWTGIASAASWGSLALLVDGHLPIHMQSLTWAVPILVATTAMSTYAIIIEHYRDYLLVLIVFVLSGIILAHGWEALGGTIAYVLFAPVIYATAKRYHHSLVEAHDAKNQAQATLNDLADANNNMRSQYAMIAQEDEIARHVFQQLTRDSNTDDNGVHAWNQAMGNLSGDLIQVTDGPNGEIYIFLGDFTGHGLPAALGAVPTSTVFKTMASKGLDVNMIARELNEKLHDLLPTGYFCCAAVIRLAADRKSVRIWNGGLPPVAICHRDQQQITQIPSDTLPLGVVADAEFSESCTDWPLLPGDTIYVYSDGLTEAENIAGEMWGRERLVDFLNREDLAAPRLDTLKQQLLEFTHQAPVSDDISIVEIEADTSQASRNVA